MRKTYLGVKLLEAEPMTRGDYNVHRGWTLPADEDGSDAGFLCVSDSHTNWLPEEEFKRMFFELSDPDGIHYEDAERFEVNCPNIHHIPQTLYLMDMKDRMHFAYCWAKDGLL